MNDCRDFGYTTKSSKETLSRPTNGRYLKSLLDNCKSYCDLVPVAVTIYTPATAK